MERFLDPELLGLALGQHEALPSPSALSELITKAELGLLQHRPDFDSNLKRSGWYLHAIGSSKYALETYGIERQRAAFQISGHIFDVFLQSQDTTTLEKLKYSFASQVAYLRSQLDPNAIAIYTRASSDLNIDSTLVESSQEIALSCAVALLGMNVDYIYRRTNAVREEINRVIVEWEINNIFDTPFGAAGGVSLATRDLISYLVYGRVENLDRAKELLITSIRSEPSLNDHISRWSPYH